MCKEEVEATVMSKLLKCRDVTMGWDIPFYFIIRKTERKQTLKKK